MSYTITTIIECGEKTCAAESGRFCHQFGTRGFGAKTWCYQYDKQLFESDGWTQRCPECLEAEAEQKVDT